jgi:hypothetical protein
VQPLPLAWAPFFPFDAMWRVRDGAHSVQIRGGPGAWPRDHLMLDWKGTLSKQFQSHVPSVSAEFNLQTLGRVGPNIDFSGDVHSQPETTYQEQSKGNSQSPAKQRAAEPDEAAASPEVSDHRRPSKTTDDHSEVPSHEEKSVPLRSRDSELSTPPHAPIAAPHFASKPLKPQHSERTSSYTSTTQYAPELVEPPRAKLTSPEVLAERAARAAAEGGRLFGRFFFEFSESHVGSREFEGEPILHYKAMYGMFSSKNVENCYSCDRHIPSESVSSEPNSDKVQRGNALGCQSENTLSIRRRCVLDNDSSLEPRRPDTGSYMSEKANPHLALCARSYCMPCSRPSSLEQIFSQAWSCLPVNTKLQNCVFKCPHSPDLQ